ncbi:MAG TPA: hypothetical protein VFL78_09270 [Rhodanobacteraceae bacterium]|nr:hypothetical protein [Rhodanobacteraceae bacterium]
MNVSSLQRRRRADTLYDFVTCSAELLASHDECRRRELEDRLLAMLPEVQATPVFEVFTVRNPALRAMLDDNDHDSPLPVLPAADNPPIYQAW